MYVLYMYIVGHYNYQYSNNLYHLRKKKVFIWHTNRVSIAHSERIILYTGIGFYPIGDTCRYNHRTSSLLTR